MNQIYGNIMKPLRKIVSNTQDLTTVQNNIEEALDQIMPKEIIDGHLLKKITLTNAITNRIEHKLGRIPQGFIIVKQSASVVITSSAFDFRYINLIITGNAICDIWVF